MQPIAPSFARRFLWVPLVAAAVLAIYLPGLGNDLVFDDGILADGSIFSFYGAFELRSRTFSYGTFSWVQALLGEGWWKQRLFNLAIHMGVVAALFAFYREILRALVAPPPEPGEAPVPYHESLALGFAVGFFALNPVAIYGVAYLIQRSILLATLFTVLALWAFARGLRTGKWWLYLLSAAFYAFAVMSKEHAVLAPVVAVPVYVIVARPSGKRLTIVSAAAGVLIGIAGIFVWARFGYLFGRAFDEYSFAYLAQLAALDPDAPARAWSLSIINQSWLFLEYGFRWFVPVADWMSISMRPPFPLTWLAFPQVLGVPAYLAALVGGSWLVVRYRDWRALVGLSFLMPAILFATEFLTVWVQDPFVLYRSYLWAIGVPGLVFVFLHGTSPRALVIVGFIVGILFTWQATERVLSLATPETAWSDAIRKLPNDPRAVGRWFPYLNRGSYYADHDRFELAIRDFETSAALGDLGIGAFNAGSMFVATNKPQQAIQMFDAAEKQGYNLYNLWLQRGFALAAEGKQAEAYAQFEKALNAWYKPPPDAKRIILLQLGRTALIIGRGEEAVRYLRELLQLDPRNAEAAYVLAMAHVARREYPDALQAIDKSPATDSGPVHYARALAYQGLGRKADAAREIGEAIRIGPPNPVLLEWQARIRAMP